MNKRSNTLVIIEKNHPHYEKISALHHTRSAEEALNSFETYELIIDLTSFKTKHKIKFLNELYKTSKAKIISDLTLCWAQMVKNEVESLIGGISLLFFSPTNHVELSFFTEDFNQEILDFLSSLNLKATMHKDLTLGFHYPRVISMIVNEAYFAKEEHLASDEDIDLAMKNGVNYPLGPIEWGKKIGLNHIQSLLEEYYLITEDPRYRISSALKLEGRNL